MSISPPQRETKALKRIAHDPVSRRRFFAVSGAGGTAAALLAACGSDDETSTSSSTSTTSDTSSQFGEGDLRDRQLRPHPRVPRDGVLQRCREERPVQGRRPRPDQVLADTEQQHVDALTATAKQLGGKPAAAPKAEFPLDDAMSVLKLAATVENLGAAAYLGQAANIESPDILAAALSIHSVEGRHAAVLNVLTGEPPTPDGAFAQGAGHADRPRRGPAVPRLGRRPTKGDQYEFGTRKDRGREPQPQHAADARRTSPPAPSTEPRRSRRWSVRRSPRDRQATSTSSTTRAHPRVPRGRLLRGRREDPGPEQGGRRLREDVRR